MVSSSYCGSDSNSEGNTGARQIVTFSPVSDAGSLQRITELHPDMQRALLCGGAQAALAFKSSSIVSMEVGAVCGFDSLLLCRAIWKESSGSKQLLSPGSSFPHRPVITA